MNSTANDTPREQAAAIQTDPEVRDRIGEAIMTSIICTHQDDGWPGAVCPTCWESTQRIGAALVEALPVLQVTHERAVRAERVAVIEGLIPVPARNDETQTTIALEILDALDVLEGRIAERGDA